MWRKLAQVTARIVLATVLAVIIMFLPPPPDFPAWIGNIQAPLAACVLVCYIGKLLYDTLFYDHYWP
jgi:hypothetical protein